MAKITILGSGGWGMALAISAFGSGHNVVLWSPFENEVKMLKESRVNERLLSVDELGAALESGTLEEAWGCGTAAVVSPIGELCYKDVKYTINGGKIGKVTQHLYDTLTRIQWGKIEDTYGWTYPIK